MALVYNKSSVDLKATGTSVTIPNHPKARLMYYLNCMCIVLSLDQTEQNIGRLTDYQNYDSLNMEETAKLILLCIHLDPFTLTNVCIFYDESACGTSGNEFYEITARRTTLASTQSVMVGNVRITVRKVMCYKLSWLKTYYLNPIKGFVDQLQNRNRRSRQQHITDRSYLLAGHNDSVECSCCCNIL
ncbi:Hypothetical predicted protein [Mytilus galloprovincialis]|uniref:Uncharacterized protein n=1 Tax=Mytilus galloprovincialis TaxID=29158 RepID=A0A8B6GC06_MYTGA|nr:Hypothetical predicted protein [Mytilus galloprovincialis]